MTTLITPDGKEKRIIHDDGTVERHYRDGRVEIPPIRLVDEPSVAGYIQFMTENLLWKIVA